MTLACLNDAKRCDCFHSWDFTPKKMVPFSVVTSSKKCPFLSPTPHKFNTFKSMFQIMVEFSILDLVFSDGFLLPYTIPLN